MSEWTNEWIVSEWVVNERIKMNGLLEGGQRVQTFVHADKPADDELKSDDADDAKSAQM